MNIIKAESPLDIGHISLMLYGAAGVHKTSVATSSDSPLLVNFESAANALKACGRPDSLQVVPNYPGPQQIDWASLRALTKDDLKEYRTLVIDTVGRMIDCIGQVVERRGIPPSATFQYYAAVKQEAMSFFAQLHSYDLDLVFVAHEKTEELRKKTVIVPSLGGGSGGDICRAECVAIGYMSAGARGEFNLDFEPEEGRIAKNCGLPEYPVPRLENNALFLADLITLIKRTLTGRDVEAMGKHEKVSRVLDLVTSGDVNAAHTAMASGGLSAAEVTRISKIIAAKAHALDMVWSDEQGEYKFPPR